MPGKNIVATPASSGRRLRTEEGPWAISAAETPHDPSSYSLYINTLRHPHASLPHDNRNEFACGEVVRWRNTLGTPFPLLYSLSGFPFHCTVAYPPSSTEL
ncbi:hypothetical protein LXA43DRAFT_1067590 [Ganoderma leucocontextum]|nr:hypothetical protein LXA43DRAFT_1067590 [Ganoderma leucocontextum]